MTKKELEEALISAAEIVSREGNAPDHMWMSLESFILIGIEQGYTREEMEQMIADMPDEKE